MEIVRSMIRGSLEILFPRTCVLCGRDLLDESARRYPLCADCESSLPREPGPRCAVCGKPLISEQVLCMRCRDRRYDFDSAYPLWAYAGAVQDLVVSYKIRGIRPLAEFFADRIGERLRAAYPGWTVVPVPFRRSKLRKIGWDQVEDLVRVLERRGTAVVRALEREEGASQKTLDYAARMSNLAGKIRVRPGASIPDRIILLDDVLTTGATLSECSRVLKAAGARRVAALVLAAD